MNSLLFRKDRQLMSLQFERHRLDLRSTIQNDELFRELARFFVNKASEPEMGDDPDFLKFYRIALGAVTDESVETIIRLSESPIERIFLGSLLLGSIKWFPYGIVVHDIYKDTNYEIAEFRSYLKNFFEFIEWYKTQYGSYHGLDAYLNKQVASGAMESAEREFIHRLVFRYVYMSLLNSWHMTLQPKFPDIVVNGKSIRPDILLWIPGNPNRKILVECDGYEFHSNKHAFTVDRARDRVTQGLGFTTLRFSGSEIHRNVSGVSTEVLNYLKPDADAHELR